MNIILDTNIFYQDILMTSKSFDLLFDYLEKTTSRIILPRVVYEELSERYRARLLSQIQALETAQRKLERTLLEFDFPTIDIAVDEEVERYLEYVLGRLGIQENEIVQHKEHYLDELITRAAKRLKPFSAKGEEFRDAVLWLSVLDVAHDICGGMVTFISNDTTAFGKTLALHQDLLEECQSRDVQVRYYDSVKAFIEQQASQVEFIDEAWLLETVDYESFDTEIVNRIIYIVENTMSSSWPTQRLWFLRDYDEYEDLEFTGFVSRTVDVGVDNISDFYAYEKSDGTLYVEAMYYVEYEIEFTAEKKASSESRFSLSRSYGFDSEDEYGYKRSTRREAFCKYVEIEVAFGVTLQDGEILAVGLEDISV